ncbi:BON domain-containing protein [Pandoraea fibrosis]|uniref:Transport-associated protein n=1 Tax=Pandoraea fibrosis TaxID=1891094 RepID=A0A5E4SCK4_9BURK|nr:BON domain-containing protein [Pandoraea fibrosis]VVD72314.1 transport-associated protein [Pandoraea fibrosis]
MAKRIPPARKSSQDRTVDAGAQHEQHALTHEDGDAETNGAQASAPSSSESAADAQTHEARQSAARDAQTAHAQTQNDPAWLGASDAKQRKMGKGDTQVGGGHGYAPEIAHGEESGYGPANAAPGAHPRFGRQSAYGPHDDYAGTGRDALDAVSPVRSPSQSRHVDWPEGTQGAEASSERIDSERKAMSGEAGQATGSKGRGGDEAGHATTRVRGKPQETVNATVHARSRGPSSTDIAVRDAVHLALSQARDLDVSHVDISVASGLVLLTGHVPERWMQHVVQTVVSKVAGVSGVDNRLHERRDKAMSRPGESQEGHKI